MTDPALSLVVATRNRLSSLRTLVEGLAQQSPTLPWELVVVDNGSEDGSFEWVKRCAFPRAKTVLSEPRPGKSRALNRGIDAARGALLVFTDDDVAPAENWLAALADAAARHPSMTVFGGPIRADAEHVPDWIARSQNLQQLLLSAHDLGGDELAYPPYAYPIGPNMAVRAAAVAETDARWPTNRGPGTRLPLGDERGFLQQVSHGTAADRLYVPGAAVRHAPEPEQLEWAAAVKRCLQGGFVAGYLDDGAGRQVTRGQALRATAAKRLRAGSARELVCVLARAVGVASGRVSSRLGGG